MFKTNQTLTLVVATVVALALTFLGWKLLTTDSPIGTPPQQACTLEAKICPDGSSVGRTGPNCEFEACPSGGAMINDTNSGQTSSGTTVPAGWQTYAAAEFGFKFSYPPTAEVRVQESYPPSYVVFQKGPTQQGQTELYDGLNVIFQPQQKADSSLTLNQVLANYLSQQTTDGTTQVIQPLRPTTINSIPGFTYTIRGLGEFTTVAFELPQEGYYLAITNGSSDPQGVTTFAEMSQTIINSVELVK
jgi:hypothetical protein